MFVCAYGEPCKHGKDVKNSPGTLRILSQVSTGIYRLGISKGGWFWLSKFKIYIATVIDLCDLAENQRMGKNIILHSMGDVGK